MEICRSVRFQSFSFLLFPISFVFFSMSKRQSSSNELSRIPKRQRGFRRARPAPSSSQPTDPSSNTSLFITVSQPDERRGILQARHRVLPSTSGPSVVPTPDLSTSFLSYASDSQTTESVDLNSGIQDNPAPQEQQTVKPKRKRNTTNAVCYYLPISAIQVID